MMPGNRVRTAWSMLGFVGLALLCAVGTCQAQGASATAGDSSGPIKTADVNNEIRDFLARQVSAHVADIKSLNPPPERVVGALTTGEFSWGTFMRALAAYSEFAHTRTVAGRDVIPMIAGMAPIELRQGGKAWAQLYAAQALRSFGTDLNHNALWQSLSPDEQKQWKVLLDPGRFYDVKTRKLIKLPENYFGVAARIAAIDFQLGLMTDRKYVDDLLDRAALQFSSGALFADDALPTGRYDRYSNEYARAIYDAAEMIGRADVMKALAPSLHAQMQLWWDLLSPDGYGYSWGRSLGAISYMDTMEIAAFVGAHPEFRPAPIAQIAAAYYAAWRWLRHDFDEERHLLMVFAFGQGDYSYITKEREWQQTTTFLAKVINADEEFMSVLEKEGVASFAARPSLSNVARFVYFRDEPGRKFGVWVVRQGNFHFALPFVTGPRAATSDYEPAPHGLPGFAVPVEKIYPCFIPFIELEDGRTIAAADGADEIRPAPDGLSVTAIWNRWVVVGAKAGETVDPGLKSQVTWSISDGQNLYRSESLTASRELRIRRMWMAVPTRADVIKTSVADGARIDEFTSPRFSLDARVLNSDWPLRISAFATGDDPLGRGDRGAIPLHLILETAHELTLPPESLLKWEIELTSVVEPGS
ncbi:MAG: hypothetical protein WAU89_04975 [Candidatus Acidiferrales bacterium]